MKDRTFYTALLPTLFTSLTLGYMRDTTFAQKPLETPPVPQTLPIEQCDGMQGRIDVIVTSYSTKYTFPGHATTYIQQHFCDAFAVEELYGLPAAGVLAKAASEHSFGSKGDKIKEGNNHFGIKWREQYASTYPECFYAQTSEYTPENKIRDCFVIYPDARASYAHFGEFLTTRETGGQKVYAAVLAKKGTAREFLIALADSAYSTNLKEKSLTLGILDTYHLEEIVHDIKLMIPGANP